MSERPRFAAIDLGAESGRVMVGEVSDDGVELSEAHRFSNRPVRLPDGLRWDLPRLLRDSLDGLAAAAAGGRRLCGVGVDGWGVDYGLLDECERLLGLPFHYRDARTDGLLEQAFQRVSRDELFAATGIQTMPINTAFQLLADEGTPMLEAAQSIALVPDLLVLWLCGGLANEATVASTTGLLQAGAAHWARQVIEALGIPLRLFKEVVEPGTRVGTLIRAHADETGLEAGVPVFAVASHDTASAFVAAPMRDPREVAVLCSGTWSLLGIECQQPVLSEAARAANLTNERGLDGTTRLLKNVMGLWLLQECRRACNGEVSYEDLLRLADEADGDVPLFDPDADQLLTPGDMPQRIADVCWKSGQDPPEGRGAVVRSIVASLACKYRYVMEHLEHVVRRELRAVHLVGGGVKNALLCQLTADLTGRSVLAGPVEASALGNVLVQARAAGWFGSLAEMREATRASMEPRVYDPGSGRDQHEAIYQRFLEVTGLQTSASGPSDERVGGHA